MSTYVPYLSNILGITNAQQAIVTFTSPHSFSDGEIISLRSSRPYGMYEINNLKARVLSITSNTVTLELDTTSFNTFVYPPVGQVVYPAVAVPSASGIIPGLYPSTVNLQDAYDNEPSN